MLSPYPLVIRSNDHFLLAKIFYYVSGAKANIGTAKTYRVGSERFVLRGNDNGGLLTTG
jgi:hypothetical protein